MGTTHAKNSSVASNNGPVILQRLVESGRLSPTTRVYHLRIVSAVFPVADVVLALSDPYFQISLVPPDPFVEFCWTKEQIEITAVEPRTLEPVWDPPNKFQMIVSTVEKSRIVLAAFSYNPKISHTLLGHAAVSMKSTLDLAKQTVIKDTIPILKDSDGSALGSVQYVICILFCFVCF